MTDVIEGRVEKTNMASKLPGIKLADNPTWFNKSKDEYLQAPFTMPQPGQFVRMLVNDTFAVGCEILPPFEAAPVAPPTFVAPPAAPYNQQEPPPTQPTYIDPTRQSIEAQVCLKAAVELIPSVDLPDRSPFAVADLVVLMAMRLREALK